GELDAVVAELPLEGGVVLDDAVVDDGDAAVGGQVRVGVAVGGGAVGGPAGVADADAAGGGRLAEVAAEGLDAGGLLAKVPVAAGDGGEAGAVVAAVLQAVQPLDEDRLGVLLADVPDNAAHGHLRGKTRPGVAGLTVS